MNGLLMLDVCYYELNMKYNGTQIQSVFNKKLTINLSSNLLLLLLL